MKNVKTSGPMNDFNTKLSTFFTSLLDLSAKVLDFFILFFLFTQKERTKEKAPQTKIQSYPCPAGLSQNKGRI
jgi:hypothetical protein